MSFPRISSRCLVAFALTGVVASLALPACKDKPAEDDDSRADEARRKKPKKKAGDDDPDKDKPKKKTGDDDDDPDKDKPKKKTGDEDPPPPIKSGGDKLAPTDEALKSGSEKNVAAYLEGEKRDLKFGKAVASMSGLHVTLSTEKLPCSWVNPSDETYTIDFDLPPGPGSTFFAGHAIGLPMSWNSQRVKLKQTFSGPHLSQVSVDPFKVAEGEHIKGTLRFDTKWAVTRADGTRSIYEYKAIGPFDVTICDDYAKFAGQKGEAMTAPPGPVAGTFAGAKFEGKSVLATVLKDYSNGDKYIDALEVYPVEATCADRFSLWKKEKHLTLRSIGGTGSSQKMAGTQQPADPTFTTPSATGGLSGTAKWFGGSRRAWVRFDKVDYTNGAKLTGALLAESPPTAKPDETGSIGGQFTATVCSSTF